MGLGHTRMENIQLRRTYILVTHIECKGIRIVVSHTYWLNIPNGGTHLDLVEIQSIRKYKLFVNII